jgi:hypothetical protein
MAAPAVAQSVHHERTDEKGDGEGGHHDSTCGYEDYVEEEVGRMCWGSFGGYCIDRLVDI